jgi:tetratricopeptide (TPR) repeat protein
MMTEETPRAPHGEDLEQLKASLRKHGTTIAVAVGVLAVVVVGSNLYRKHRATRLERAGALLGTARSAEDLQSLLATYPKSPAAALAMLKLAKSHYDEARYDEAMAAYEQFQRDFPDHELEAGAVLGKAHCLEAKQQYKDALEAFSSFVGEHPEHFLTAQAIFGKGRCLELLDRDDEARTLYEDFIAANPDSEWLPLAEELLEAVGTRTIPPKGVTNALPWGGQPGGTAPFSIPVGPPPAAEGEAPDAAAGDTLPQAGTPEDAGTAPDTGAETAPGAPAPEEPVDADTAPAP